MKLRSNEVEFRLRAPRKVNEFDILHVEAFQPGDQAGYASAIVVTRRLNVGDFCTHRLIWADDQDTGEWFVQEGHYDIPTFAAARENARKRGER